MSSLISIIKDNKTYSPAADPSVFLADNCRLIGDVKVGARSSVWYNVTIRGDVMPIQIGKETNIQDGSVIHGTHLKYGTEIGDRTTIGHGVILHGCKIGNQCLIGMGTIIMDGAHIEDEVIVGAGSLVTEGFKAPKHTLVLGRPAKVVRNLNEKEIQFLSQSANNYLLYQSWYQAY